MRFSKEDKEMVARLLRGLEHDYEELCNDRVGHSEIVSDLKESCREKMKWLEKVQQTIEQEPDEEQVNPRLLDEDTYQALCRLGILDTSVRSYNRGTSDYSQHIIQPWTIWQDYHLNPFDADIVKRILRTKQGDPRRLDYEKIIHICEERIRQLEYEQEG